MKLTHDKIETERSAADRARHPGRSSRRRPGRDRAAVLPALDHAAGAGHQAVRAAAAGRARHLYPRGLLQLPLADDPAVPRRDAALRPLLGGRRVRLRPPVPVGQQAHRPRPGAGRRALLGRVAPHPPQQSARRRARSRTCRRIPGSQTTHGRRGDIAAAHEGAAPVGVPYTDEQIAAGAAKRSRARPSSTR